MYRVMKRFLNFFIVHYYLTFLRLLSAYRSTLKLVREKNFKMIFLILFAFITYHAFHAAEFSHMHLFSPLFSSIFTTICLSSSNVLISSSIICIHFFYFYYTYLLEYLAVNSPLNESKPSQSVHFFLHNFRVPR